MKMMMMLCDADDALWTKLWKHIPIPFFLRIKSVKGLIVFAARSYEDFVQNFLFTFEVVPTNSLKSFLTYASVSNGDYLLYFYFKKVKTTKQLRFKMIELCDTDLYL